MTYPVPAIGTRLTADFLTSMLPISARKSSTSTRISTITNSADTELVLAVEANAVYTFNFMFRFDGPTTADVRFAWTFPTGTTGTYVAYVLTDTATGDTNDRNFTLDLGTTGVSGTLGVGTDNCVGGVGSFITSATSGSFTMTWAQFASIATACSLKANSYVQAKRIG